MLALYKLLTGREL